jgi:hypothetical protein
MKDAANARAERAARQRQRRQIQLDILRSHMEDAGMPTTALDAKMAKLGREREINQQRNADAATKWLPIVGSLGNIASAAYGESQSANQADQRQLGGVLNSAQNASVQYAPQEQQPGFDGANQYGNYANNPKLGYNQQGYNSDPVDLEDYRFGGGFRP